MSDPGPPNVKAPETNQIIKWESNDDNSDEDVESEDPNEPMNLGDDEEVVGEDQAIEAAKPPSDTANTVLERNLLESSDSSL
jgi:hypothetical protein